jgi:hypothetical protein
MIAVLVPPELCAKKCEIMRELCAKKCQIMRKLCAIYALDCLYTAHVGLHVKQDQFAGCRTLSKQIMLPASQALQAARPDSFICNCSLLELSFRIDSFLMSFEFNTENSL